MKLEELGRRAVACPRWRWLPGMAVLRAAPGTPSHGQRQTRVLDDLVTYEQALNVHIVPDLSDPATLGCLLYLVREVTGEKQSSPSWYPGGKHDYPHWAWYSDSCYGKLCEGATEAECLVRVLEYKQ